jgi:MGT family glycosyltransferase
MSGYSETVYTVDMFSKGIAYYVKSIVKAIASDRPDIIVSDFTFFASSVAADLTRIPCVVVYHSGLPFRGDTVPPFGSGLPIGVNSAHAVEKYIRKEKKLLQRLDYRVNSARRKFNLPALVPDVLRRPYSKWLNLVTSIEAAEAPRNNLTSHTLFIGPCYGKRKGMQTAFPFEKLRTDKFKVYASLGTVFNNRPDVFRRIIDALDGPEYQVVISAGGAYRALSQGKIPQNVLLFKSVPQIELLPQVDLVIGHGGNNSTNETIAAGKPLIVIPVGGEQADNASRMEFLGVGRRMSIKQLDKSKLRQAIGEIRMHPEFLERAAAIKQAINQTNGLVVASHCIGWVARHRKPLYRPSGLPLTITKDNLGQLLDR